jgi:DNA ligase-associated metallophosphoesterase
MKQAWLHCAGTRFLADPSGALFWPEQGLLVVADLHFEKGSSLARRGTLLPPYDTRTTLTSLEAVVARFAPRTVISLGDGFHDGEASARLAAEDRARLAVLVARHDWVWLLGNHDPRPPVGIGGQTETEVEVAGTVFRHVPAHQPGGAEIAGHLHPSARVTVRGRRLARPCFVADQERMILPAFGSYTGGLDVFDPAIADLFANGFEVALLGDGRVHPLPQARLHQSVRGAPDLNPGRAPQSRRPDPGSPASGRSRPASRSGPA